MLLIVRKFFFKNKLQSIFYHSVSEIEFSLLYPQVIVEDCQKVFTVGSVQYDEFVRVRLVLGTVDVMQAHISKNNLKLPANLKSVLINDSPQVKLTPTMFNKLRDACEIRVEAARNIFSQEFTNVPECFINKEGKAFHSNKSDLLSIIAPVPSTQDSLECPKILLDL